MDKERERGERLGCFFVKVPVGDGVGSARRKSKKKRRGCREAGVFQRERALQGYFKGGGTMDVVEAGKRCCYASC